MEGYLTQQRYWEEGLGPASYDGTDFVDFPREASLSLEMDGSRVGE